MNKFLEKISTYIDTSGRIFESKKHAKTYNYEADQFTNTDNFLISHRDPELLSINMKETNKAHGMSGVKTDPSRLKQFLSAYMAEKKTNAKNSGIVGGGIGALLGGALGGSGAGLTGAAIGAGVGGLALGGLSAGLGYLSHPQGYSEKILDRVRKPRPAKVMTDQDMVTLKRDIARDLDNYGYYDPYYDPYY